CRPAGRGLWGGGVAPRRNGDQGQADKHDKCADQDLHGYTPVRVNNVALCRCRITAVASFREACFLDTIREKRASAKLAWA
ncbi:MAG: hypothetical protein CBE20_00005, partial [Gammaproteobacteria bacterium TMED260]